MGSHKDLDERAGGVGLIVLDGGIFEILGLFVEGLHSLWKKVRPANGSRTDPPCGHQEVVGSRNLSKDLTATTMSDGG